MTTFDHALDRARGLMAGLLVGDTAPARVAAGEETWDQSYESTCLAQLACFTLEGSHRFLRRFADKGIGAPPLVVSRAYTRWALMQGIEGVRDDDNVSLRNGWLYDLSLLAARRRSAPATVAAIETGFGSTDRPTGSSAGHHALTRTLPWAIFKYEWPDQLEETARELAALTHGDPTAWDAAAAGCLLVSAAMDTTNIGDAVRSARANAKRAEVHRLLNGEGEGPADTATHAFRHGLAVAAAHDDVEDAVRAAHEHGAGAATFAGAVIGALRGMEAVSYYAESVDLVWVADRLAVDAVLAQAYDFDPVPEHLMPQPFIEILYPGN